MIEAIKKFPQCIAEEIKRSSEIVYLVLLGLYRLSLLLGNVFFVSRPGLSSNLLKQALTVYVLIFLGIYIGSILVLCVHRKWAILPIVILVVGFIFLCAKMQRDIFDGLLIAILVIGAYGKCYTKCLKVLLWCTILTVATAMIGVPIGFTAEAPKSGLYGTGLSFGFLHPNVFGGYVFFIFVLVWYLYVHNKSRLIKNSYFILSWGLSVFMVFIPKCRTAALLLLLFPVAVLLCRRLIEVGNEEKRNYIRKGLIGILIIFPFVCFFVTYYLGTQREWLVVHTLGTYVENFSKRFIQGGLAFKEHGFPLFGELIRYQSSLVERLGDYDFSIYVLDNGYVTYAILRGMIWMIPAMLWLSYSNWKMVRRRDAALLAIAILFCLQGLMDRYTFTIYNFCFLYPLAVLTGEKNVGDFPERIRNKTASENTGGSQDTD